MTATTLCTVPAKFPMATTEELPLGFNTTPLLAEGQTPSSARCVLLDLQSGEEVALTDTPTTSANFITQIVDGSILTAGSWYSLSVTFNAAVDTTWTMVLEITVPQ